MNPTAVVTPLHSKKLQALLSQNHYTAKSCKPFCPKIITQQKVASSSLPKPLHSKKLQALLSQNHYTAKSCKPFCPKIITQQKVASPSLPKPLHSKVASSSVSKSLHSKKLQALLLFQNHYTAKSCKPFSSKTIT